MALRRKPTEEDRLTALRVVLEGLARAKDVFDISADLAPLHPKNNTFPGEVFTRLAADALAEADVSRDHPLPYEGVIERFLPECEFRGRDNHKIQFALLAAAATRGGVEPDLLDEVVWWHTDDFWRYGYLVAVIWIRASADQMGVPVPVLCQRLADRREITISDAEPG
jgi:hypothetical protein